MIDQPLSPVAKEEDEVRRADGAIAVELGLGRDGAQD
jgi:hypothetical protein